MPAPLSLLKTLSTLLSRSSHHEYPSLQDIALKYNVKPSNYFGIVSPLATTQDVLKLFELWRPDEVDLSPDQRSQDVVVRLHELGWTHETIEELAIGISLPLKEAIRHCLASPPTTWESSLYVLVGRPDLAAQVGTDEQRDVIQAKDKQVSDPFRSF